MNVLTLAMAIQLAQRNSLAAAVSTSKLAQARLQIAQTYAGLYPQLSLSSSALSYDQIDSDAISPFGGFGGFGGAGGLGGTSGGLGGVGLGGFGGFGGGGTFATVDSSLTLTQVLFDGFQEADALRIANASVAIGEVDLANQIRTAGYDAANAYIQVLRADSQREVAREAVEQAQAQLHSAQLREHAGVGTRFDVIQAISQVASVQGQLASAMHTEDLARLQLSDVLGTPLGNTTLAPAVTLPIIAYDPATDLSAAISQRPELETLTLKHRLDEATAALDSKANYPKAQAEVEYSQLGLGTGRSLMALAGVSWNLVDWGKAGDKVRSDLEGVRQDDQNLELTARNLATDIQSAYLSRQDAGNRLSIAEKGLSASLESYRMARVRFDSGVGTGYDVINAQNMLVQAENTYYQADYDLQAAEVKLAQALGLDLAEVIGKESTRG